MDSAPEVRQRPRLLIIIPSICRGGGGVSEAAKLLAASVVADGKYSPEVVTLRTEFLEHDLHSWPDIPVHAFRSYGPSNYGFSPGMLWFLFRRAGSLAHVHGVWMFHCLAAQLWSMRHRAPLIISPHGMLEPWILNRSSRLKRLVGWLYQNRLIRNAAVVHTLTQNEARDVLVAVKSAHTVVIPNFVRTAPMLPSMPRWWGASLEGRRIYLFLGRIHDKKGWRELCEAWDRLCNSVPGFTSRNQLVFCGWPDSCPEFEPTVARLAERHDNVVYAGPQHGADRDAAFGAADFFLLPSKSEGLPMVILEAWAAGVPTLMTRACNLDEGFATGAAIETSADVDGLVEKLAEIDQWSTARLAQASEAARLLASEHFGEAAITARFSSLYAAVSQEAL